MTRALPEWIAKHDDQAIPPRVQLRVFEKFEGICSCGCNIEIATGMKWDCDHKVALCNGGQHRESNLQPMLVEHHRKKTRDDIAIRSYNNRRRLAHAGIKQRRWRPMPGSKSSPWKKTFTRGTVRR